MFIIKQYFSLEIFLKKSFSDIFDFESTIKFKYTFSSTIFKRKLSLFELLR